MYSVGPVGEDEVGRALGALGEHLDAGVDGGLVGGGVGGGRRGRGGQQGDQRQHQGGERGEQTTMGGSWGHGDHVRRRSPPTLLAIRQVVVITGSHPVQRHSGWGPAVRSAGLAALSVHAPPGPCWPAPPPPHDTRALAAALADLVRPGDLVLLAGEMGAGKTAFAQGFGRGLGVTEPDHQPHLHPRPDLRGRPAPDPPPRRLPARAPARGARPRAGRDARRRCAWC